jgi:hypothetical protein
MRMLRSNGGRLVMDVVAASGQTVEVEFRIRLDTVEVWALHHCCGILDRELLRAWLTSPWQHLVVDEVRLTLDTTADPVGRIAMSLPEIGMWPLTPLVLRQLQGQV